MSKLNECFEKFDPNNFDRSYQNLLAELTSQNHISIQRLLTILAKNRATFDLGHIVIICETVSKLRDCNIELTKLVDEIGKNMGKINTVQSLLNVLSPEPKVD